MWDWLNTHLSCVTPAYCGYHGNDLGCLQAYQSLWPYVHSISDSVLSSQKAKRLWGSHIPILRSSMESGLSIQGFLLQLWRQIFSKSCTTKSKKESLGLKLPQIPPPHKETGLVIYLQFSFGFLKPWEGSGVLIILSPYPSLSRGNGPGDSGQVTR